MDKIGILRRTIIINLQNQFRGVCREEIEDAVQDALFEVWDRDQLSKPDNEVLNLLYVIASNRLKNALKKQHKMFYLDSHDLPNLPDTPPDNSVLPPNIRAFLKNHKHGWIISKMEESGLKSIKQLAVVSNIKKEVLYKRYQKLVKDLSGLVQNNKKLQGG